jgi:hypothetical protein
LSFNGHSTNQIYSDADEENKNSRNDVRRRDQPKPGQYEQEMEQSYKVENNQRNEGAQDAERSKKQTPYDCDPVEEFEIGDEGIDELNTIGMEFFLIWGRLEPQCRRTQLC